ncbi:hypothetical protein M405DRAFT_846264 [Rhizopogon salebrosus TDB-379]|nr:hypothetical protein M405DRAFT_846264 [Rhizopogon salebrosus TDB-379]
MQGIFYCYIPYSHFLYVTHFHVVVFHSHNPTNCMLKTIGHDDATSIQSIPAHVQSAIIPSTKWPFSALTHTIQLGIGDTLHFCIHNFSNRSLLATIIILQQSFTLSQLGQQDSGGTLALAASEYMASQTRAAVKEAVKEVLHEDDIGDEKLSKMIIDIISKNSMSKVTEVRK